MTPQIPSGLPYCKVHIIKWKRLGSIDSNLGVNKLFSRRRQALGMKTCTHSMVTWRLTLSVISKAGSRVYVAPAINTCHFLTELRKANLFFLYVLTLFWPPFISRNRGKKEKYQKEYFHRRKIVYHIDKAKWKIMY